MKKYQIRFFLNETWEYFKVFLAILWPYVIWFLLLVGLAFISKCY